ncbi:MAG: sensor histidine kinase [Chitinophagaceae bacterium]
MEPLIAFLLLWDLRKIMKATDPHPRWDKRIRWVMAGIVILFIIHKALSLDEIMNWVWHLSLLAIIAIAYFNKIFFAARTVLIAVLPFAVVQLSGDILKLFMSASSVEIDIYVKVATTFSIIWMIAMLFVSKKQQKALAAERLKTHEEEEKRIMDVKRKEELEKIVVERTAEITRQKEELENTLTELKATQVQLIHSEKMASLGELTAGIAHEIQNPLNFVNNFSEVNKELMEELKEEIDKGNINEVKGIADDVIENQKRINYHGKRADAIVKGMLQHSRSSSGVKEPTDINELADEYLRLAYHGLRAKDKSFNAAMETDFDNDIEKVNIIPQDIGRVILNLITNAFYAVKEKKNNATSEFEPTVSVSTKKGNGNVVVIVKDNGNGIPQKVLEKIFQPFFTTKPTGEGTGLGLSLSYDIIKAHQGELKVETKEGVGATFSIILPQ